MLAVVLSFDQFPLRLLGCYGNPAVRTPCFDRIAAAGLVFDQHFGEDFSARSRRARLVERVLSFSPRGIRRWCRAMPSLPSCLNEAGVESRWLTEKEPSPRVPLPPAATADGGGFV